MRAAVLLLLGALLAAPPASAATVAEREEEIARASAARDALAAERARLAAEARSAADGLTGASGGTRADGALTQRLRAFDRLASRLDDVERRLAEQDAKRARARAAFDAAAADEEGRLEQRARREGAPAVAASMAALEAARRRVAQAEGARVFRPPLAVAVDPQDGPAEMEAKLAIVASEEARVRRRQDDLAGEAALVAARTAARREWARALAAARRDAGGAVELLDRGDEDVRASLRALEARAATLARETAALDASLVRLAADRARAEERLAQLRKGR